MITHTRAIILRSVDYQESSKIITVLSQEHGKIALIARGARKPKSKLAGSIEVGNIIDAVYYYKSTRGVQSLTESSVAYASLSFRMDIEKAAILYAVLELAAQLVHDNEVNDQVFAFLNTFIQWLGEEEEVDPGLFPYVQVRCATICGIGLTDEIEDPGKNVFLNITSGSISNEIDSELSYKLNVSQAQFLQSAISSRQRNVFGIGLKGVELKQLIRHLDVYYKYHIDGFKERRSDPIFEQMMKVNQ